jgi:hypothetical protein
VNDEFKDVAKGNILQPKQLLFQNVTMPAGVFRVSMARVLPGYEDLAPPNQPHGDYSPMVLH